MAQSARNLFCDYREQMFEKHDGNTMDILFLIQSVNREKINMISLFLAEIFEFFVFRKSAPRRRLGAAAAHFSEIDNSNFIWL